jgi:hypothetical protein
MTLLWMTILLGAAATQGAPATTVAAPTHVAELDLGKLKGEPAKLAWSPDGSQFYFQTVELKRNGSRTERHFTIDASSGAVKDVDAMPGWAAAYWQWKSHKAAPGAPTFEIQVSDEQKTVRATAAPMGGDLARGGTGGTQGTSLGEATSAASVSQQVRVITLRLKGETVGEFVNGPLVPGLTFGWSPAALGLIAFTDNGGKVVVMDQSGAKKEVPSTSDAVLPAWSDDGTKLAFLKKDGRRKYVLQVAKVDAGR